MSKPAGEELGQSVEKYGERGRIRTCDPCLKRALLYQLSYAPILYHQALAADMSTTWVPKGPIASMTLLCAARFTGIKPCVYVSSVILLSA